MYLGQILSIVMYAFGGVTTYLGIRSIFRAQRDFDNDKYVPIMFFSSSVWSFGFSTVHMTLDPEIAYYARALGMAGVFLLLIVCQFYMAIISNMPLAVKRLFCAFVLFGIPIFFLTVNPNATNFYIDKWGMTYTFESGLANNIYSAYSVIVGINMMFNSIWLATKSDTKRDRSCGRTMVGALCVIIVGMVMDTLLPLFNMPALPGSTITQFMGAMILFSSYDSRRKCRITVENMAKYAYSAVSQPVLVFSPDKTMKLMNMAAEEFFSESSNSFIKSKTRIDELFSVSENFFDYEGAFYNTECMCYNNKTVYLEASRIEDRFADTIGFIVTVKDMTSIKQYMKAMEDATKIAESNSLAKSVFLSNMSHEIRTPLNAIVGLSELLLKDGAIENKTEAIEEIRNSSNNLLAIINDVLDISKIESGKMELVEKPYELHEVIRDAFFITETLASKKGLKFSVNVDEEIPISMYGDPVRIRGVLVNILNNAVKYTKEGSVNLTVKLERIHFETAHLLFKISDTGIGIKKNDIKNLFSSFTRFDAKKNANIEGTGLGLAIVKGYVELMKGTINVQSIYGEGTTFIISIPQRIVDGTSSGEFKVDLRKASGESNIGDIKYDGVKILAVDDNRVNLKVVSKILEVYKMDVHLASDGPTAIKMCKEDEYDVILMDQMMPDMNGIEAMKIIREISDHYKVGGGCLMIALTANAVTGAREHLIEKGFDDYISKPINFAAMEGVFNKHLKR